MKFEFTDTQINQIVQTLAQRPYAEVFDLMNHIQRQAAAQGPQTGPQLVQVDPPVAQVN
jgi:hypothetical protein